MTGPSLPELWSFVVMHHGALKGFALRNAASWTKDVRRTAWTGLAVLASMLRRLIHLMAKDLPLAPLYPAEPGTPLPPLPAARRPRPRPPRPPSGAPRADRRRAPAPAPPPAAPLRQHPARLHRHARPSRQAAGPAAGHVIDACVTRTAELGLLCGS